MILERFAGAQLFKRAANAISLTTAGERLLPVTVQFLDRL
jgi:DNA-binding transcriptional LysR family regulator